MSSASQPSAFKHAECTVVGTDSRNDPLYSVRHDSLTKHFKNDWGETMVVVVVVAKTWTRIRRALIPWRVLLSSSPLLAPPSFHPLWSSQRPHRYNL